MKICYPLGLLASIVTLSLAPAAYATVTTTPYNPANNNLGAGFGEGNENAAQTITFQQDANGLGVDVFIQVNPAGPGSDNADTSLGEQFSNLYFGTPSTGATLGFELSNTNTDAFVPAVSGNYHFNPATYGITFTDIPGTLYASGGVGSRSETYIPYSFLETNPLNIPNYTPFAVGNSLQLRDVQAFSYAGNNGIASGRFGVVTIPAVSAAPEPAAWALLMVAVGMIGSALRLRRRRTAVA